MSSQAFNHKEDCLSLGRNAPKIKVVLDEIEFSDVSKFPDTCLEGLGNVYLYLLYL